MRYLILNTVLRLSCLSLICMLFTVDVSAQNFDLKNYVWHKRVLIIFAVDARNERFNLQISALKEEKKGLEDRDLVVVNIFGKSGLDENNKPISAEKVRTLRKKYAISDNEFKVILIGKDGGTKKTADQPLDNQQLFKIIDMMPMRKDEMQNKEEG